MWIVVFQGEIIEAEAVDFPDRRIELHSGKMAWAALKLSPGLLEMILVEMEITEGVDKIARFQITYLGHHQNEEGIGCNIEGDPEKEIGASLV